jgi:hypothetical protein
MFESIVLARGSDVIPVPVGKKPARVWPVYPADNDVIWDPDSTQNSSSTTIREVGGNRITASLSTT